jgi:hypothetical protein
MTIVRVLSCCTPRWATHGFVFTRRDFLLFLAEVDLRNILACAPRLPMPLQHITMMDNST